MPRPKARTPFFELGGYWIAREPDRPCFWYFWNDAGNGRTRRASLGTEDLERAKLRLAEIVLRGAPATGDTLLATVLENYFIKRTDHLPSKKNARLAGRLFLECWGPAVKCSAIGDDKLKEFVDVSVGHGHSTSYIARNFSVLAAAMSAAKLVREIPMKAGAILDKWPDLKPTPKRKIFEPTDEDLARLLRQDLSRSLRRWLLNSMATLARPMAVAQLTPAQRDRKDGMVSLNQAGRRQNKKFRPTLREPKRMTEWLTEWEGKGRDAMAPGAPYAPYSGRGSINTVLRRACAEEDVNLPKMSLYSIRHRGTTVLRNAKVPKEQIDYQLGHVQQGARTTQDYGEYGPEYLAEAARALDVWIGRVLRLSAQEAKTKVRRAA